MSAFASLFGRESGRSREDRAQDGPRRVEDMLAVADLRRGQRVLEIEPGKGWFTGILLELLAARGELPRSSPPRWSRS